MKVPSSINKYLREYQRDGVRFLFRQYTQKQGGILADDMGLGKVTHQICRSCLSSPLTASVIPGS